MWGAAGRASEEKRRSREKLKVEKEERSSAYCSLLHLCHLAEEGQASAGPGTHKCDRKVCMKPGPGGSVSVICNTVNFSCADIQGERNSPTGMAMILLVI